MMRKKQASNKIHSNVVIPFYRSGDYFFHKGLAAFQDKRLSRAAKLFERAVKLTETEPIFKIQLAAVLTELGEYERSNELLHQIIETNNDEHPVCHFFIANNEVFLGHFFQAEKHVTRYLALEPEGAFVDDAKELAELFEEDPLDEEEKEEESLNNHENAWILLTEGNVREAIPLLKKVLDIQPENWAAQNHLAEAFFRTGQEQLAFDKCEEILESDHGNLLALCNIAVFHYQLGYTTKANQFGEILKKIQPIHHDSKIRLLHVLCHIGAYEEVAVRKKDHTLLKEHSLFHCFAVADYHVGNVESAIDLMKEAISNGDKKAETCMTKMERGESDSVFFSMMEREAGLSMLVDNQPETPLG
ncbi:tetratricopeptide repeat protein [Shouchella lehensis]|uniref:Tetratricopeptide repeat protein n=1 Tax=Shouchella lehensis TaxID=300825 RepID=A0A4Y7WRQ1_9BACI|nr:tetratricopeptide repeat protein [Shouchella lehensis]RQW21297.1 tetratricopeptide repeat protein [Bacillus sp. C1-1]TES51329.1 tetratricopeptide repeat protein [Shouchella lehensis]